LIKAKQLGEDLTPLTKTPQTFHEVEITYHNLKLKKPFELSLIGDTHYASQECLEPFLNYSLERVKNPPRLPKKNSAMIHMGDAYEANDKDSPEDAQFNQKYTNEESKDHIINIHKPLNIRKKLWVWMEGNHDGHRSRKKTGTANSRDICQVIDVPYARISSFNIIDFNAHRLIVYTNHGKNRSTPRWVGTRRKTWEESMVYPEADIIAIGHIHKLRYEDIVPNENITENVVIDYHKQCMTTRQAEFKKRLITGHFLGYLGGYGQRSGYAPNPAGYPIIKLNPDGTYDVEKVWHRDLINNGTL